MRSRPRFPWFKDEQVSRWFPGATTALVVRVMLAAVVVFAAIVVWAGFQIINTATEARHAAAKADTAAAEVNKLAASRQANAAAQLAVADAHIRQLACALVADTPDSSRLVAQLRAQYHCPRYDPTAGHSTTPAPRTTTVVVPQPTVTAPTPTPAHSSPSPSRTPAPSRTPRPSPSSPLCVVICP